MIKLQPTILTSLFILATATDAATAPRGRVKRGRHLQSSSSSSDQIIFNPNNNGQPVNATQLMANLIDINGDVDVRVNNDASSPHIAQCAALFSNGHSLGTLFEKDIGTETNPKYELVNEGNATHPQYVDTGIPIIPNAGIILSSGKPADLWWQDSDKETTSWNTLAGGDQSNSIYHDGDLQVTQSEAHNNNYKVFDSCVLQFEFKCTGGDSYVPIVSFKYVFGSEEYYEYVDSQFNDVFGFYLNGENIAKLPTTDTGTNIVSINNVNYNANREYFNGNDPAWGDAQGSKEDPLDAPTYGIVYPNMEADGFTDTMIARGSPKSDAAEWNTIKLAVGDVGDSILDSWVILESASFTCVDITAAPSTSLSPSLAHSSAPSTSSQPTHGPSSMPSITTGPSLTASLAPSISSAPTTHPSSSPTISSEPSITASLKPSVSAAPSVSTEPTLSTQPTVSSEPTVSSAPTESSVPTSTTSPTVSSKPTTSSAPTVSSMPTTSSKPTVSSAPTISSRPTTSSAPTISSKPTTSTSPTVSSEPSTSSVPTISSEPSTSTSPTVSSEPSTSSAPTVSSEPTTSSKPTVSSAPTISSMPSTSSAPSISSKPTITGTMPPSISSEPTAYPTEVPTDSPSKSPSASPTANPSSSPTNQPSNAPTLSGSIGPNVIFNDVNGDGIQNDDETVLEGVEVSLYCTPEDQGGATRRRHLQFAGMDTLSEEACNSGQTCYGVGTKCTNGHTETCCGQTHASFICDCGFDWNSGQSTYMCYNTDACMHATCLEKEDGEMTPTSSPSYMVHVAIEDEWIEPVVILGDGDGTPQLVETVTTNWLGQYEFDQVLPGQCYITVTPEVDGNNNYVFSPIVPEGNQIYPNGTSPTVDVDYNTNTDGWDVGIYLPLSNIGPNVIFNDANQNGIQDGENEGPLQGVSVTLMCDDVEVATTVTSAEGEYEFNDVQPGECYIQVSTEIDGNDNYVFSPIPPSEDVPVDAASNQINVDGTSPVVTIGYNDTIDDWNVGMHLPWATVGPAPVFNDLNQNGLYDMETEVPLADIPIALICDDVEVATTTSNETGYYEFTDVAPGYCFIAVGATGQEYIISPIQEGGNQILSDGTSVPVYITYDQVVDFWLVGMHLPPATIGPNVVFDDEDGDGVHDEAEPTLTGITVDLYCYDESGTAVLEQTVTTDENGEYMFEDILPSLCYIQVIPPSDPDTNEPYVFSPIVEGGNQIYPNGTSPEVQLDWEDNINTWNAGVYLPVTLGNKVWEDLNGNGIQDEVDGTMEEGIADVKVDLLNANDEIVATMLTEEDGSYWFTGLSPGEYGVQFELPPDFTFAGVAELPQDAGGALELDYMSSEVVVALDQEPQAALVGATPHQVLTSGENNTSFDAGIYVPVQVTGQIFDDLNGNGVLDEGEPLIGGATIYVVGTGLPEGQTITSSDGTYSLDLPPGTYQASITPPTPDHQLSPLSDPEVVGNDFNPLTSATLPVALLSGDSGMGSFDAGFYVPVSITNQVFDDANGNGIREADEGGYPGPLTVNLYDPNSTNPEEPIISVVTDEEGNYNLPDVPPGNYELEFVPEDEGVAFSQQNVGNDECADSDVDPLTGIVSIIIVSGDDVTCIGAGITSLPGIGPNVIFEDDNGNGIQDEGETGMPGVPVYVHTPDGTVVGETVTNESGEYDFSNLEPGDYYISVDQEPDFEWSPVIEGGNQIYPNGTSPTVTLVAGTIDTTLDVGMYEPVLLGNKVWNDLNGDGVQQADEPPMIGVDAILYDGEGSEVNTATTDDNGHYIFSGLRPGDYQVEFILPDKFIFTVIAKEDAEISDPSQPDGSYAYEDVTSDVDHDTGRTDIKNLKSGDENYSFDAGMFIPVQINGTTWHDLNADGVEQHNETGLANIVVTLFDGDGEEVGSQTTDTDGVWLFADMPPGTYHVMITPPEDPAYLLSPKPADGTDTSSSDFDPETWSSEPVSLEGGTSSEGLLDAGLYLPATIGGYIWFDNNPNGLQEEGEKPFNETVVITMYDELGYPVDGKTTESDTTTGLYEITGIKPGKYALEFELPGDSEYQFTVPFAGEDDRIDSDVSPVTDRATVTVTSNEEKYDVDAGVMDFGPYYPDWRNDIQVCTNDGFDPAWLEIQKDNYLYKNKEECCKTHFWWRMTQCMANEEFKFFSNDEICDTKIFFEDWEDNSPASWTATTQYDTLEECCASEFWFEFDRCLDDSPVMFKFEFCVDINGLVEPQDCQSADIFQQVLEDAMNEGMPHDHRRGRRRLRGLNEHPTADASITRIGDVTLSKVDGSTVCGGSLEGQAFINPLTGTIPDIDAATSTTQEVCGTITVEEQTCSDEDCLMEHYGEAAAELSTFVADGRLNEAIIRIASERLPPVPELQAGVTADDLETYNVLLPATVTGDLNWQWVQGSDPATCTEKAVILDYEHPYGNLIDCCNAHFGWDVRGCCLEGGGCPEIGIEAPTTFYYYPNYEAPDWCQSKASLESWESVDESFIFSTRDACCEVHAQNNVEECKASDA